MDHGPYSTHAITTSGTSYPSPSAISPHQLQHPVSHTLPPLQPQTATAMQSLYSSHPHTPRTPATPNPPGSANAMSNYPPPNQPAAGRGPAPYMSAAYGAQPYTTSTMMPQTTMATSHQPIAPAAARGPPVLRPMPAGGVMPQPGVASPYGSAPMMPNSMPLTDNEAPTHVVGSQGRRGILPSAPGRPAAPMAGTSAAKTSVVPQKNEEGKFPCPHCTKTYLHAKHLKRHLLRHTGDRPYMCVLCRDTFSRSDILKRHFQKCSIRRGNPTGASHLSHPQAHVKKNAAAQKPGEGDLNHLNGMSNIPTDPIGPFGMVPVNDGMGNMANEQSQLSRSNSITRLDNGSQDQRGVMGPSGRGNYDQAYAANFSQPMPPYNMPSGQNGMPMYGSSNSNQQSGPEWAQMFQSGAQSPYGTTNFPPNIGQTQIGIKTEPNTVPEAEGSDGFSGPSSTDVLFFETWGLPTSLPDPFQHIAVQILRYFFPPGSLHNNQNMELYFSPENIRDFLNKYTHFHVHFPILHTASFRILESYTGLLAGMCCIGACYSDRVSASNVREMMDCLRAAMERDATILTATDRDSPLVCNQRELEELQALLLMQVLLTWNGTPGQRERARQIHPITCHTARRLGLLQVSKDMNLYSLLHQPDFSPHNFDISTFDWSVWVEQEKRIRLMHIIHLCDVAMGLYFNVPSHIDPFELAIPLPSDDASWDARTSQDCADAMGLHGPEIARAMNSDGTQRSKQPEMNLALQALLHSSYQIQPGSTNLYGKFILIHAILSLIRREQLGGASASLGGYGTPPMNDWMVSGGTDGSNSGRVTPVEGLGQSLPVQTIKAFSAVLDKFKSNWDMDMVTQFPPSSPKLKNPRRYGFGRDGVHFYWVAMYLLKHTQPGDLQKGPDYRFTQVIALLKKVKTWVMSDGASRGEELGSVGEIDESYGVKDLTLDMADLFKPLPNVVEEPGITSVKTDI